MIRLYDTAARAKRDFEPADPKRITMYVCGPTVYGRAHIGNARPAVVFDTLARLLRHTYGQDSLVYARNITDVDDKIIEAAAAEGVGYRTITETYYKYYMSDMAALNVLPPSFEPRATAFIPRMIDFIERLLKSKNAYVAEGHVLFDVTSDPEYGSLSKRTADSIVAGSRVEIAPYKRHPADFVLWKPAGQAAEDVALSFSSPWGQGRPGWHIECSAMIEAFGSRNDAGGVDTIDIHGGGLDLVFPHHENEAAQSRCAHNAPLANYWLHNGFVDFGAQKMSKSLGNVVTPGDLLAAGHKGEVLRLALLSAHYRSPLPWTEGLLESSKATLDGWRNALRQVQDVPYVDAPPSSEFLAAISDDLNTPAAIAAIGNLRKILTTANDTDRIGKTKTQLHLAGEILGFGALMKPIKGHFDLTEFVTKNLTNQSKVSFEFKEKYILSLIDKRREAKLKKNFALADEFRELLKESGIILQDKPDGSTTWHTNED